MRDGVILLLGYRELELGDVVLERALLERLQTLGELWEETLHANAREAGELHACMIRMKLQSRTVQRCPKAGGIYDMMYLNRPAGGDTVSEVAGVEVALQASD